jgi:hypothetical protein
MASPGCKALRAGAAIELDARGGSMWPLIATGDRLSIEPATPATLRLDDLAVVETAHGLVAHRVVSLAPLRTRGDRMPCDDGAIACEAIVGRVRAVRRAGITLALDSRVGRACSRLSAGRPGLVVAALRRALARLRPRPPARSVGRSPLPD